MLLLNILFNYFPVFLAFFLLYFLLAPWYFWGFYKLISPFIDPVTKNKIKFVDLNLAESNDSDNITAEKKSSTQKVQILDYVDKDQLESEYGGNNNFCYEHEIYWNALLERIGKK